MVDYRRQRLIDRLETAEGALKDAIRELVEQDVHIQRLEDAAQAAVDEHPFALQTLRGLLAERSQTPMLDAIASAYGR